MANYLMRYPSSWGMGSDVDIYFVTETNLKRLLAEESKGSEELEKRLSTCSTYAGYNDLIRLPDDMKVTMHKEHMTDTIFRVFNQWRYARDVIVRDASFTRYVIDVQGHEELTGLKDGRFWEFTGYDFKGVLMNSFCPPDSVEEIIECEKGKIERYSKKLAGVKTKPQGYISDFVDMDDEWLADEIEESKKIIAHLQEYVPPMKDDYYEHLYNTDYGWWDDAFRESIVNDKCDHTRLTYSTLLADTFGCICSGYEESQLPHRFDEIFKGECNIEYLLCSATGNSDENAFGKLNAFSTLVSVFGYD